MAGLCGVHGDGGVCRQLCADPSKDIRFALFFSGGTASEDEAEDRNAFIADDGTPLLTTPSLHIIGDCSPFHFFFFMPSCHAATLAMLLCCPVFGLRVCDVKAVKS